MVMRVDAAAVGRSDTTRPMAAAATALTLPAITNPAPATSRQDVSSDAAKTAALAAVSAVAAMTAASAAHWMQCRTSAAMVRTSRVASPASGAAMKSANDTL